MSQHAQQRQAKKRSFKPDLRFIMMVVCVLLVIVLSFMLWLYPNGSIAAIALIVLTAITAIANLGQWLTPTFTPAEVPPPGSDPLKPPAEGTPSSSADSELTWKEAMSHMERPDPESVQLAEADVRHNASEVRLEQQSPAFFFCVPLPDPGEFYDRRRERNTIINRAYKGGSTSIIGERRSGKTWLLQYTRAILSCDRQHLFRVGYLDVSAPDCKTIHKFIARALEALGSEQIHGQARMEKLESMVRHLRQNKCTPVLCLDEFEFFTRAQEFDLAFFAGLRAIAQAGLVFVIASKVPLIDAVTSIVGAPERVNSPFFNIFEQVTLKPFNKIEAEKFVREKSAQVAFTEVEQAFLLRYGRTDDTREEWPPVRLQLVGSMLLEDKGLEAEESGHYSPNDPDYWLAFERQLEEKYHGVVRT
ncbi:MAG TPA: ATP-binding protein [Ktedonosporobacter sp.]|nr:ATP-binding protein [Ktedonosporobacter sp.]